MMSLIGGLKSPAGSVSTTDLVPEAIAPGGTVMNIPVIVVCSGLDTITGEGKETSDSVSVIVTTGRPSVRSEMVIVVAWVVEAPMRRASSTRVGRFDFIGAVSFSLERCGSKRWFEVIPRAEVLHYPKIFV